LHKPLDAPVAVEERTVLEEEPHSFFTRKSEPKPYLNNDEVVNEWEILADVVERLFLISFLIPLVLMAVGFMVAGYSHMGQQVW